ncbi:MAG TPA: glycosyltransferase family 39 protein [Candidatus Binatia bacterium]|nr:glycosyltransferase family 39 protein [Candidatus Binatia bacterium]
MEDRTRNIAFAAILVVGILVRLYVAAALDGKAFNDTAIVGLMAMHELAGRFYAFYWGQSYMGSTESLSIAPFFALFGVNEFSLSIGLLPWFVLFTVAVYALTELCRGKRAAIIAALLSAVAPGIPHAPATCCGSRCRRTLGNPGLALTSAMRPRASWAIAAGLLVLAAAVRFWGIYWGAPERIDLHPDEMQHVMSHALAVSLLDPDPKFLNYPSFLIYLIALANGVLARLGLVTAPWQSYVTARSIVATFGALTVPAAFWLAMELTGSFPGAALAALWVALLPLHVWESHFAVTDVVMTFWIFIALAASVRLLRSGEPRDYAFTGAAIGFGIASKYTAALVGIAPLVASLLARRPIDSKLKGLFALVAAALVCSFVGTPFSFLHFGQFLAAMAYENDHVHSLHYGFSLPAAGWQYRKYVYELCAGFPFSFGFALYASAIAGTVWALVHLRRELVVLLSFAIPFFLILGHWTFTPLRYQMPVVLVGAILAGLWQGDWIQSASAVRRTVAWLAVVVTVVYTTIFSFQTTDRLRHDTRTEAAHWLDETLKPGERLLLCGYSPYLAIPTDRRIVVNAVNEVWIGKLASRTDFDLVEITAMHYWRHQRHRHPAFEPAYHRFRAGETGFRLVKSFDADFLNRDLYRRLDPMFAGYFISPTLEFYARTESAASLAMIAPSNTPP